MAIFDCMEALKDNGPVVAEALGVIRNLTVSSGNASLSSHQRVLVVRVIDVCLCSCTVQHNTNAPLSRREALWWPSAAFIPFLSHLE